MSVEQTVLVVGAGPTGLTMAHELARHGVPVRLIDGAAGPAVTSRALATHPRTLETYDQMGVLQTLLPRGRRVQAFTLHQNGRVLAKLAADYSRLPTRFPFTLMVDQVITEEVLREAAAARGVAVEWGTCLASVRQDGERALAQLRGRSGLIEDVEVPWLIGCDGAHSTVRKQLGLSLLGDSSETWLIADAMIDAGPPDESIHWVRTRMGTVMAVPYPAPGKWRLLDTVDVTDVSRAEVAERFSSKLSAGLGRTVSVQEPSWVSVFTIQQRMIQSMRSGRCFVAGDAAHVHSPASGQGMNTGIQDACNLAWKLAAVARGRAADRLLDTYSAERVPIGRELLKFTARATHLIQLKNPVTASMLPIAFTAATSVPALKSKIERKIMGGMSALGLSYRQSPLTASQPGRPTVPAPGERAARVTASGAGQAGWAGLLAELQDPRWCLLLSGARPALAVPSRQGLAENLAAQYGDWLSVRLLSAADGSLREGLHLGPGAWLLIRPDGYVAARGDDSVDGSLTAYLAALQGPSRQLTPGR